MKRLLSILAVVAAFLLGQAAVVSSAGGQDLTTLLANFLYNGTLGRAFLFSPDNTYDIGASGATRPANIFAGTNVISPAFVARMAGTFNSVIIQPSADGVLTVLNNAATDFSRLQFGGTTSSFPALKRSGNAIQCRLADDSAFCAFIGSFGSGTGNLLVSVTAPTISSGFGTSPSVTASNGTAAFLINVGTGAAATSGVIGLPAAATGWVVYCDDMTTPGVNETKQTASATTTATVTNYNTTTGSVAAWGSADVLRCLAMAY